MSNVVALIDADIVVYEAASVFSGEDPFDGGQRIDYDFQDLQERVDREVALIEEATDCKAVIMVFSPDNRLNFRKEVYPQYKSNRKGVSKKPPYYWELVSWCRDHYASLSFDGLEGDDVMGIFQTRGNNDTVIVSSDKDMRTVPGKLYNHKKKEFSEVTLNEANWFWMYQTLTGDSTDGYGGCPGIGDKKANALLPTLESADDDDPYGFFKRLWTEVLEAYAAHYKHPDVGLAEAIRNARLARILREPDYDFDNHIIKLWHPDAKKNYGLSVDALRKIHKP